MTRALILYHSLSGNTKNVAISLAKGIEESGIEADCLSIDEVDINKIPNYDFFAIGGPTHNRGMSQPMKAFLGKLRSVDIKGKKAFAFDTKYDSFLAGSAGKRTEKELKKLQLSIAEPYSSAIVKGKEGPLEEGMEEIFQQIGVKIAELIR